MPKGFSSNYLARNQTTAYCNTSVLGKATPVIPPAVVKLNRPITTLVDFGYSFLSSPIDSFERHHLTDIWPFIG
jgi:hypothetical protein